MANDTKAEAKPFLLNAKVTMIATDNHPFYVEGHEYDVHPNPGRKAFNDGFATYKDKSDAKDDTHVDTVSKTIKQKELNPTKDQNKA